MDQFQPENVSRGCLLKIIRQIPGGTSFGKFRTSLKLNHKQM